MKHLRKVLAVVMLGLFAIGTVAGCMGAPTAPVTSHSAGTLSGRVAGTDGLLGAVDSVGGGLVNLVVKVLHIVGSVGGSLSNGRWRVDVPAGAFDGSADVGIGVMRSDSPTCQLSITPEDKNHFVKSVRLTATCLNVPSSMLKDYVIYWYNPATQTWTEVAGSTVDLKTMTVSAPLSHFSDYAVGPRGGGKAGW